MLNGMVYGLQSLYRTSIAPSMLSSQSSSVKIQALSLLSKLPRSYAPEQQTLQRGYIIYSPDYTPNSAGIRCLFTLCDLLNQRGFPSYMTGDGISRSSPTEVAPIIDIKTAIKLAQLGFVVIYPETVPGNPLRAKHVCRWVLNRPGLLGGDRKFDERELIFNYSEVFKPYIQNKISGKLYMPTIDETIFYCNPDQQYARGLECYYVGKSTFKEGFFDKGTVFEITRDAPKKEELGKLFRSSKVLYCFDNSTILIYEAILCGCSVVVIPDGTQKREDYETLELGMQGIAWGIEELSRVQTNPQQLREQVAELKRQFNEQLEYFIKLTQSEFG